MITAIKIVKQGGENEVTFEERINKAIQDLKDKYKLFEGATCTFTADQTGRQTCNIQYWVYE